MGKWIVWTRLCGSLVRHGAPILGNRGPGARTWLLITWERRTRATQTAPIADTRSMGDTMSRGVERAERKGR